MFGERGWGISAFDSLLGVAIAVVEVRGEQKQHCNVEVRVVV